MPPLIQRTDENSDDESYDKGDIVVEDVGSYDKDDENEKPLEGHGHAKQTKQTS